MLLDAIGERASDIHLERYGELVRVRIRVDGDLRDVPRYRLSPPDLTGIVNVIKIRASLDITEHRLPQGGRFRVTTRGRTFDLRVQTQPALHGEHVVIRLLPQEVKILTIEDLGYEPEVAADYRRLLDQPAGLVLVVGPTGSGKTTTLYAGLQLLARDLSRKVITVEDPIEYAIDRIQQTAVRPEIGFSFANAMRSFVRQDPDVILVGEIRDHETALEAIRASQTGHLVLSTLHCNDSTDAVQRLIDLEMHPNSIASELLSVISQRLARRICDGCKREAKPDPELLKRVFPEGMPADFRCWKGIGCGRCGGHGTFGRIACVEFLRADSELRSAISRHPPVGELRRRALQGNLMPLRGSALTLVAQGKIAFEDLPFLLSWERLAPERCN
jgi:type IV pilus assembly protein PilB